MRTIIQIFLLLYGFTVTAQPKIEFDKYLYNYGPVSSQWLIPAHFTFTNEGDQPLAILLIEKGPDVIVKFENRFFASHEKGVIEVFFDNNELGNFREELWVYTNQSDKPIKLIIKGRNVDILECNKDKRRDKEYCKIYVIDKEMRTPIHNAGLNMIKNNAVQYAGTSDKQGMVRKKIEKGQYNISIEAEGYYTLNKHLTIGYSGQVFVFELEYVDDAMQQEVPSDDNNIDVQEEIHGSELPSGN